LKEAVLGMKETERTSCIVSIASLHGWHAQSVAFDSDAIRETGHLQGSIEQGETVSDLGAKPEPQTCRYECDCEEDGGENAKTKGGR
jgi:hypothetical protein